MGTLKSVKGKVNVRRNTWCGPAALSIVTGCGYDRAVDLLKRVSGRPVIKGVSNRMMFRALGHLGYDCADRREFSPQPTLARWLRERDKDDATATFLVEVTRHYVVVRGRKIADNLTMGPVFLRQYKGRRRRVQKVWKIVKV